MRRGPSDDESSNSGTEQLAARLRNNREYTCCFVLNIRIGTLIYGLIQMIVQLTVLCSLMFVSVSPPSAVHNGSDESYMVKFDKATVDGHDRIGFAPPDPAPSGIIIKTQTQPTPMVLSDQQVSVQRIGAGILMTSVSLLATSMLVSGVLVYRSSWLLPFFFLQCFEFVMCCLSVGNFYTIDDVKKYIAQQLGPSNVTWMSTLDQQTVFFLLIICIALILTVKAYFIAMVFSCYKYVAAIQRIDMMERQTTRFWSEIDLFAELGITSLLRHTGRRGTHQAGATVGGTVQADAAFSGCSIGGLSSSDEDIKTTQVYPPKYDDVINERPAPPAYTELPFASVSGARRLSDSDIATVSSTTPATIAEVNDDTISV